MAGTGDLNTTRRRTRCAGQGRGGLHHPRPGHPYQAGVDLARQLGAALITYDGTQHTAVFDGNDCVDTAVVRYFVELTLPPANLRCGS
ncbi:hypothetical protein NIIDMKKI_27210 [Mycobacterium kansasii]|uniref:Peptidase S33 tripeptidyl aminopeptidase-like C-terminal domain-containing protein n=1 Tax=Mycobacterium kansasii TaxID=1768 RepID=A0A7G1ICQ6_MYCKA|nr:hypothetical protein NIIDMKKI_27210 [Mycobacterium kansasii]